MDAFVDGDDLCAGCHSCCHDVDTLLITPEELARVPLMEPYVVDREGDFLTIDMPGACPYLRDDGWCGTFETRPFDCSLFPAEVGGVRRARTGDTVTASWRWGGHDCPQRTQFIALGATQAQREALAVWVAGAVGTPTVTVRHDRSRDGLRGRVRREAVRTLDRTGLASTVRRALGRTAPP